jgi:uncharacterized protein
MHFLQGHVYHSRTETARNSFKYPVLNLYVNTLDLPLLKSFFQKKYLNFLQIRDRDYLSQKQFNLDTEIKNFVQENFSYQAEQVFLQSIPRMFGYVFNPVSFWYFRRDQHLDAVLCEVSNTFGEKHYYWLYNKGEDLNSQWLESKKEFHVSPFFDVKGKYKFKFSFDGAHIDAAIHLLNADESTRLITWVKGDLITVDQLSFAKIFFKYGWITPLVVARIHYQAFKLFLKKVKFYSKPELPENAITRGDL